MHIKKKCVWFALFKSDDMECTKCNKATILSILALSVSSVTIALFFVKVTPNSVVDSNTFIGILAAFIGISDTLLIGYQVYNAVEIKQELSKFDRVKEKVCKSSSIQLFIT